MRSVPGGVADTTSRLPPPVISRCAVLGWAAGHSQGTTIALAAFSSVAGLQHKVSLAVLLAPVAFAHHLSSAPVQALAELQTDQVHHIP